jgi:biopolymer transport protein ExbB/TolQ
MEVPRIEKSIRAILGVALLAPLGMLGTLLGMLETFQKVSEQGRGREPGEGTTKANSKYLFTIINLMV